MESRIMNAEIRGRKAHPEEAARLILSGMTVAMGGYTSSGYPKVIPRELVKRREAGEELRFSLITGANVGPLDELFSGAEMLIRRAPMCMSKGLADQVNHGKVHYVEQQMNKMPGLLEAGAFGEIDVAVVEALMIHEDGSIVPTSSVGMVPNLLDRSREIIVEINMAQPVELIGLHDIYRPGTPPGRKPIPLEHAGQRIGTPFIKVNPDKIKYVVQSELPDQTNPAAGETEENRMISYHLFEFLEREIKKNYGGYLPPFQTGFGNLASNLVKSFAQSDFRNIQFFCGGLGEANMELLLTGKVTAASTGSIEMTPKVTELIRKNGELLKEILVIRNGEITNSAEVVGRLGVIALNSGIEADIYGNVNSSHIGGNKVVNGIGGGASFAQNAGLSVLLLPSTGKGGAISNIVPMVFHTDIGEHDVDVFITEHGTADLRGKDELERGRLIIGNCAGPAYRDQLTAYLEQAIKQAGGHHPQLPCEAYSWYERLKATGTMRI